MKSDARELFNWLEGDLVAAVGALYQAVEHHEDERDRLAFIEDAQRAIMSACSNTASLREALK